MDLTAADEKLLKALAIAIVDHPRATFKEIAQAAGVSKATLNRFCGTRDQGESVNILLNFTQFFETRIEYRFQIFTAHSCDFLLPSYARLA